MLLNDHFVLKRALDRALLGNIGEARLLLIRKWTEKRNVLGDFVEVAFAGFAVGAVLGVDALVYHLTEIVTWARTGHPGQVVTVTQEFPVGYYPVTNEVLLAWGTGIARSFAPARRRYVEGQALDVADGPGPETPAASPPVR